MFDSKFSARKICYFLGGKSKNVKYFDIYLGEGEGWDVINLSCGGCLALVS